MLLKKAEALLKGPARKKVQHACEEIIEDLSGKETSQEAAAAILKLIF
jgi:hypothetical protein